MRKKRKTVWAFLDGKKLVDVVQAALDNNMMVDDLKAKLIASNQPVPLRTSNALQRCSHL